MDHSQRFVGHCEEPGLCPKGTGEPWSRAVRQGRDLGFRKISLKGVNVVI